MDVAIIGLACRFPAAADPGSFWHLVREGREVTQPMWDSGEFDADFFNLSPREASAMDPRQRVVLELAWELLEDAFVVPETLRGEPVSVYLGAMTDDYATLTLCDLADNLDHHTFTGISRAMIANRISYAFGLHGPSMTVDSGQSSSLVAVHLGCESVRTGESPLAIAGGVHLNLADEIAMLEREFGAVSVSGRTYAFDRRADGYVRGEGAGLVLLKPLPAALECGDRIHAVIRGSAVGNAGHHATAQTVPSARSEADVIRRALDDAGLKAVDIDYIEAHGTGTPVGDAIEAQALGEVFAERAHDPVRVGSVKTNIGHTGSAAGVAGLLKAVLALEHSGIPPSLNYQDANPEADLKHLGLQVNTALVPWPPAGHPRRAGVSSFGMGGTNAHLIVEQPPPAEPAQPKTLGTDPVPWVLSARSEGALVNQAQRLSAYLADRPEVSPLDVAWSLVSTRTIFEHRAVVVGDDRDALITGLAAFAAGESGTGVATGRARSSGSLGKTVFVFPGQGSQWPGMGRQLYERFDVFSRALDEAAAAVDAHLRLPIREVMWGSDPEVLRGTEFAQPAMFVLGIALAALWQSFGVTPDVVMGHSVGEIAAACVAGVLSLAEAARLVAARGALMGGLPAGGVMVAVDAGEAEVAPLLNDGVSIAAVNGPHSVVLSGAGAAVEALADRLAHAGRRVHRLAVSHAFHTPLMDPMVGEFSATVADIETKPPRIGLISNLTGQFAAAGYGSAQYWAQHVGQPVRFFAGVRAAEAAGAGVFLELGPGAALTAAVDQSLSRAHSVAVATMGKDRPETESLLGAVGQLFTRGLRLNWGGVFAGCNARRVDLPTYGFVRQRFWLSSGSAGPAGAPPATAATPGLAHRLHGLAPDEQHRVLVELVCDHAAAVLGHPGGHTIDPDRVFGDLGFDSLIGVELRNRLTSHTGLALSRTLIFDYPTPAALADHLRRHLLREEHDDSEDEKIWSALRKIPVRELRRTGLLEKLLLLAGMPETPVAPNGPNVTGDDIDSLSPDDLIAIALNSVDDVNDE